MMKLQHPARALALIAAPTLTVVLVLAACQRDPTVEPETTGVDAAQLPGSCYGVALEDDASGDLLLGNLCFDALSEKSLTGTWNMESWGAQAQFASLPVNEGRAFPDTCGMEAFEAEVFGDLIIAALPLGLGETHLGIVLNDLADERLTGTVALLPTGGFEGTVDGVLRTR